MATLYYIHDPMCAWCWGFRPAWAEIQDAFLSTEFFGEHPNGKQPNNVQYVLGGLAPDSDEPMAEEIKRYIQANWQRIQQVIPQITFNYDFWEQAEPRRSTYPSCRAVIAAKHQGEQYEQTMILAIQTAYYLKAKNPSNIDTLCECAQSIGLDTDQFSYDMQQPSVDQQLNEQMAFYHQLSSQTGISGFPSLVLHHENTLHAVPIDYNHAHVSLYFIQKKIAAFSS